MKRKQLFLIAGIFIALVAVAVFFAAYSPTPPKVLKQNLYKRTFTDHPFELLSLDVIIYYETEADGTWRTGSQVSYNLTVLVKPTLVNQSMLSKIQIIHWEVGDPMPFATGEAEYLPAECTPLDFGIELTSFWANQSAWCAVRKLYRPYIFGTARPSHKSITYNFLIREILTDGASNIFNVGDSFSVAIS